MAISGALVRLLPGASVLLATSAENLEGLGVPPSVEILKLPGLRKVANDRYVSRRLPLPDGAIRELRSRLLASVVESFRPQVVLADKHPFGVGGELRLALEWNRAAGGTAALGLRDILDDRETVLREWAPYALQQQIDAFFDRVLIYGHRELFDPIAEYDFSARVRHRTVFCGYVVNHRRDADHTTWAVTRDERAAAVDRPLVMAVAGGGEDGVQLLQLFLLASRLAPWQAWVVTGPMIGPENRRHLEALAAKVDARIQTFLPNMPAAFERAATLVCMGGYNTIAEAVSLGIPVVCLPRSHPRREQLLRARAFARLGLIQCLEPGQTGVASLRRAIETSLVRSDPTGRGPTDRLRWDGAEVAAQELIALAIGPAKGLAPAPAALVEYGA